MIFHVFANRTNAGDWLSALGIQRLLHPMQVTELLCDAPFVTETLSRLDRATPHDFVIIGGGGLFMDYFDRFWDGFAAISHRFPYAIWGVGHCELTETGCLPVTPHLPDVVRRSRLCVVRDELTRAHLGAVDLEPPLMCPSVVALTPSRPGRGILHAVHPDVLGPERYQRVSEMVRAFAAASGRHYQETNHWFGDGDRTALRAVLDGYASADLIVSSRLHGCIIGLAMGRRVLAISGDRKVDAFMDAAGLADWVCDVRELDVLPTRLQFLPRQEVPHAWVDDVRRRHRTLAERLRLLLIEAGAAPPRPSALHAVGRSMRTLLERLRMTGPTRF